MDDLRGKIIDEKQARRLGIYKPYQLVFDPTPKQKYHKELVALIPPLGHELDCPIEFAQYPYAKYEWLRIMELDGGRGIITPAKREIFYGYCLMVERRKALMLEWDGVDDYKAWFDKNKKQAFAKKSYIMYEIERLTDNIETVARRLGLYNLEEGHESGEEDERADDTRDVAQADDDDTRDERCYVAPDDDSDLFD